MSSSGDGEGLDANLLYHIRRTGIGASVGQIDDARPTRSDLVASDEWKTR